MADWMLDTFFIFSGFALVVFLVGIVACVFVCLWIGART